MTYRTCPLFGKGRFMTSPRRMKMKTFFTIESAYLVASYKDVGVVGEPVLVRGYRTPFAGKAEREWGAYSGIQDEATSDKAVFSPEKREALDLRESKVSMGDYLAPRE